MRVGTWTMYQNYSVEQSSSFAKVNTMFDSISSGQKIQYGYQDVNIQVNTLNLDNQLSGLFLNKTASKAGVDYGNNSDSAMTDMITTLTSVKALLVKASNQTNNSTDNQAIVAELKSSRQHLMSLANSSLDGQYLFGGTATQIQPISQDGTYNGNAGKMKATISAGTSLPYNIDGQSLFLGQDKDVPRQITTNVPQLDKVAQANDASTAGYITSDSTIQSLTGNPGDGSQTYFYASGTNSSGSSFKQAFSMNTSSTMSDVLSQIKSMYSGNVDVSLNSQGEIVVSDLLNGSSKLDFRMVASNNAVNIAKAYRTYDPDGDGGSGDDDTTSLGIGSTSMNLSSVAGIQPGDVLNIEQVGQVTVSSINASSNTVNFVGTPLTQAAPINISEFNVTKSILPSINTTLANPISSGGNSPQTISVGSTSGASVGGTLALVDSSTGNSIAGKITNISGTNVTISFDSNTTIPAFTTAHTTVKFPTPGSLTQSTTTTAAISAGANTLALSSTQGITVGGNITVSTSSGSQVVTVTGVSGSNVTIANPPGFLQSFASGATVNINPSTPSIAGSATTNSSVTISGNSTNLSLSNVNGLTIGGALAISGVGTFNISNINSSTNTITLDTVGQGSITIPSGATVTNATVNTSLTEFNKSGSSQNILGDVSSINEYYDHSKFDFNIELHRNDNGNLATSNDILGNVLGNIPTGITLNNTQTTFSPALSATSSVQDYLNSIQNALNGQFGSGKFTVSFDSGHIQIQDQTIKAADATTASSQLVSATLNAPSGTFEPRNGVITDQANYSQSGNVISGNIPQITKDGNEYAVGFTRLVDVAGVQTPSDNNTVHPIGMEGHILTMPLKDIYGSQKTASINFQYNPAYAAQSTTASAAQSASATSIQVPSGVNVYSGSKITVALSTGVSQTLTVTNVAAGSPQTLTLNAGLTASVTSGAKITINNPTEAEFRTVYGVSQNTVANSTAASGTTSITMPSGQSIFPYSKLSVTLSNGITESVTVSSVSTSGSSSTVSFNPALSGAVSQGGLIVITNSYDVPNAGFPSTNTPASITSTEPNNFTYNQLLNIVSMSTSNTIPSLGATTSTVSASGGSGSVSLATTSAAFGAASIGGDIMLYDNNNTPYYATITAIDQTSGSINFSYNQSSWPTSASQFSSGGKVQVGYNNATSSAQINVSTSLDQAGKIQIKDNTRSSTLATFAMYDSTTPSGYGTTEALNTSSLATNSNNAITVDDPYVSFFGQLDQAIQAVSEGKTYANYNVGDSRNAGIQNCTTMIDHILSHTERKHTEIGSYVNTFQSNYDRIEILNVNISQVRSGITDTDYASASVELNQRMIAYQALMSLATKINSLTLVNYVK